MAGLEDLGEVISTDVLILGGGIGGLTAAIKAKEEFPDVDVLLVDKQTIGWSGKAAKGGGALWVLAPDNNVDEFVKYHVKDIGFGLEDQELLYSYARETYTAIEQLAEWGVKVTKDAEGKLDALKVFYPLWSIVGVDLDMLLSLRVKARKVGAKLLNKVQVVELLKRDGRVAGAVGFNTIDGRFYIFKAKSTILANGGCNYRVLRMWASGCGDGIAAAYRAGAEMRNAEFGNFYDFVRKDNGHHVVGAQIFLNALGDNIYERYVSGQQPDHPLALLLGVEKEVNEGRGPVCVELSQLRERFSIQARWGEKRPNWGAFYEHQDSKIPKYGQPSPRPEITLGFHGEFSPIKVDHEMKTSLAGLWAIGDTSWAGSAWPGAVPPPAKIRGSGYMNAVLSGRRAGPSAARSVPKAASPEVDYGEVKRLKENMFAPMERNKGLLPDDVIQGIQEVIVPTKYNLRRRKDRMEEALSRVEKVQQKLPELWAKDGHGLGKCHEARSMTVCAEMNFRAALMRTESRGGHYREDYPERDDKNWLKWIIVKQKAGKMVLSTEPVPIDKYKVKP